MDYTKLPKDLIYQDRKMLDDFMHNQVTEKLIDNMLDINVLQISEFEKHALDCLNTAYYICTMAQVESKPEWRFGEYCDISLQLNQYYKVEYQRVVLSLVIILLECCNPEVISHSQVLIDKLRAFVTRGGNSTVGIFAGSLGTPILALREIFPRLYQGIDHAIIFPDNEFSPRNLAQAVSEDGMELSGRLYQAADICTVVTHLCKTKEEKKAVLNEAIKHGFVRMGEVTYDFSKWPEAEYNKLLSLLEKVDNDDTGKENEQKETAKEPESDYSKEQFEKLKNENERLRADFEKYKNDMSITKEEFDEIFPPNDNQQKKEEPANTDILELRKQIEEQKAEIRRLRDDNENLTIAVEGYKSQGRGMTAPDAAMLTTAVCISLNQLPANGRESLWPILSSCWGFSENTSKDALRRAVKEVKANKMASKFTTLQLIPRIANQLKELPQKLKEIRDERLIKNNPKVKKSK